MTADKIMVLDLEVENHEYYGALASPRHPDNFVIMTGYAVEREPFTGQVQGQHFTTKAESLEHGWLHIPDDVWLLVAHNAPFELDWALVQQRDEILRFLKRGGRVFCTAIAEYLLTNQQTKYPSLDEIAPKYGGSHKVDGVKIMWEQGHKTSEIDPELLAEYLYGPEGDIVNTRKVFYGQYQQLVERGMWDMALARMEAMVFNCFAMDSGLYIDKDIAFKQLREQEERLQALVAKFRERRAYLPPEVEFKESSDYHMSAWLYGGPIKYRTRVPRTTAAGEPIYEKIECYQLVDSGDYIKVEDYDPEINEVVKYKSGKNKGLPKVFKVQGDEPQMKWGEATFQCPPLIDLAKLAPEIRREFLSEFSGKRTLADGSPVLSTGKDAIDTLKKRPELSEDVRQLLDDLSEFARIDKDVGTYYLREERDDDGVVRKVSGMLQYLTPVGLIHHVLNQTSTETTRLSSNRPNFQNIPRGDTSDVKNMFKSRFGDDGYIIEADYAALEVVTLAAFSKDKALQKALLEGIDMHCMRLAGVLGEPYDEVFEKCHNKEHPEHKKYKSLRTDIKPRAFAYQYGASAMGIAFATGCTVEEAQAFIDAEKALFPEVEAWYENGVFKQINENTSLHREQQPDGRWTLYKTGVWRSPGGTCYQFRQYPKRIWADGQAIDVMDFKPTQMRNYPIQGESSFFVQCASGWVMRWLVSQDFFGGKVYIINTVHDAIYLDIHKDVLHQVAPTLKAIMEHIPEGMKALGYDLGLPFPVEVSYGPSMNEQHTFTQE